MFDWEGGGTERSLQVWEDVSLGRSSTLDGDKDVSQSVISGICQHQKKKKSLTERPTILPVWRGVDKALVTPREEDLIIYIYVYLAVNVVTVLEHLRSPVGGLVFIIIMNTSMPLRGKCLVHFTLRRSPSYSGRAASSARRAHATSRTHHLASRCESEPGRRRQMFLTDDLLFFINAAVSAPQLRSPAERKRGSRQ